MNHGAMVAIHAATLAAAAAQARTTAWEAVRVPAAPHPAKDVLG